MSQVLLSYETPYDSPEVLPVIPLYGAILFPRAQIPLNIFEPRYLSLVDDALKSDRFIGIIQPTEPDDKNNPDSPPSALQKIGCSGRITQFLETGDGRYLITLTGVSRFEMVKELSPRTPYRMCCVDYKAFAKDAVAKLGEQDVDRLSLLETLKRYAMLSDIQFDWQAISEAPNEALVNALSLMSPFGAAEKQALLEAADLKSRAELLTALTEIEMAKSGIPNGQTLQ
jgi:Uncharacterized protein, similar to the N-terminal domain of Lon protease